MLSRWLVGIHLVEFSLYALWAGRTDLTSPSAFLVAVAVIALSWRGALVSVAFVLAWSANPRPLSVSAIGRFVAAFPGEFVATLAVFSGLQIVAPLLPRTCPGQARVAGRPMIVLVHGFICNRGVWWPFRQRLLRAGFEHVHSLTVEPLFGDLDLISANFARQVEQLCDESGCENVIIVGHSMGGLLARRYAQSDKGAASVRHIFAVGTPHHGTRLGHLVPVRNTRQMLPGSEWLERLNARPSRVPITAVYTRSDNIIAPAGSATLAGAELIEYDGKGHLELALSRQVQAKLIERLQTLEPPAKSVGSECGVAS